jgi:endonuclease YncB( thermonuclease family)
VVRYHVIPKADHHAACCPPAAPSRRPDRRRLGGPGPAADFTGRVVGISDGDTLTVLKGHTLIKVRLHGVDAPEAGQDFGSRAKQAASGLAFGKEVTVHPVDTDRYGRTVAVVVLPDGRNLNHELVKAGMAWVYTKYARGDAVLARLEAEARAARRGLWSQASPIPPWDWRGNRSIPAGVAAQVVGNRRSLVYHRTTCANATRIAAGNRVIFTSEAAAGYRPGRDCHR